MHKNIENLQPNTVIIDYDTILFKAAKSLQEDYIKIHHKIHTTWTKEFKNVTELYGRKRSRDGGWIAEENAKREADNQISVDDFDIEPLADIIQEDHVGFGKCKRKIKDIMEALEPYGYTDYRIVVGGEGNFRYDLAHITKYKGDRKEKPMKYEVVKEYLKKYHDDKLIVINDVEGDDVCSHLAHKSYMHYRKTGKHLYILAYIDKDLSMCICPSVNYDHLNEGVKQTTPFEAAYCFCKQMLHGDSTDCIQGLPNFTKEICEKYGVRGTKGLGETSAINLLKGAETIKELFVRVTNAYRSYYGEEEFDFKSFRGVTTKRTWVDMLDENIQLLFMRRELDEPYDTHGTLYRMGIEVDV